MTILSEYAALCKPRISLFSALSGAAGFILASSRLDWELFRLMASLFVLACGASVLNQYQERDSDALMPRTAARPIPVGSIKALHALVFSVFLLCSGAVLLLYFWGGIVFAAGIFTVLWYNGVYTLLKRKTVFAVIPGALVGAAPPFIGYVAGGGEPLGREIVSLCLCFYLWQIPHAWLLLTRYGKEYENAGLPALTTLFSTRQSVRIVFVWLLAAAAVSLLLPFYGVITMNAVAAVMYLNAFSLVVNAVKGLKNHDLMLSPFGFRTVNAYMMALILLVSFDGLAGWMF